MGEAEAAAQGRHLLVDARGSEAFGQALLGVGRDLGRGQVLRPEPRADRGQDRAPGPLDPVQGAPAGEPRVVEVELLGHTRPETTLRYAHLSADPLKAAAEAAAGRIAAALGRGGQEPQQPVSIAEARRRRRSRAR